VYGQYSTYRAYRTCGAIAHAIFVKDCRHSDEYKAAVHRPHLGARRPRGYGPLFLTVLIAFGGSLVALGFAPTFAVVLLILVGAKALGAVTDVLAQTLIQLAVPSGLRGRAGGAWVVSIGMAPLGQFQIGALASLFGVSAALGVNGVALMAIGVAAALLVPRLRRL